MMIGLGLNLVSANTGGEGGSPTENLFKWSQKLKEDDVWEAAQIGITDNYQAGHNSLAQATYLRRATGATSWWSIYQNVWLDEGEYTVSFYIKANNNGYGFYMSVIAGGVVVDADYSAEIYATNVWIPISRTFTVPAGGKLCRIMPYYGVGYSRFHISGLQLERGDTVTPYVPTYG